ncbi:MAG: hypothetical protein ABSG46_01500 [Candidatus Binataceae bacterium]
MEPGPSSLDCADDQRYGLVTVVVVEEPGGAAGTTTVDGAGCMTTG